MELPATLRRTSEDWLNVSIITSVELLPPPRVQISYWNDRTHVCANPSRNNDSNSIIYVFIIIQTFLRQIKDKSQQKSISINEARKCMSFMHIKVKIKQL